MSLRYPMAFAAGCLATFALFFLMQWLIALGQTDDEDRITGSVIDFIRLREDSETQTKRRRASRPQAQKAPPPPNMQLSRIAKPRGSDLTTMDVNLNFDLEGGPGLGSAPGEGDVLPLVRIEPRYPSRAQSRGIEGWVLLEFTITAVGTVKDPVVLDSEPSRIFDTAAKRAVSRWKYKPKVEDGVPVERPGIQVVLRFVLEK